MNLRILFVEDDPDDAELMLRLLREAGIEPQWERVDTADALREALSGEQWQVALVDFSMPGFSGPEALGLLAELAPDIPAITVSGAISEETAVATITAGAVDYVLKGNLTRLAPAVRRAVEGAELRRRQQQAAEQARQSQFAVEHASQAIAYVSEDGAILYANHAAELLMGIPPEQIVGQAIWDMSPAVDQERWAELWQAAGRRPVVDLEVPITPPNGEQRLVSVTLERLERGGGAFMIVYARDVTEQRAAEARAREAESLYARLAENAPDIVFRYDFAPTPRLTYINPAVEAITGYSPEECYADPQLMLTMVHPDDAPSMAGMLRSMSPPDEPMLMRWIGKDDVTRWMESRIVPVRDGEGQLLAVEGITRDVTERQQAEAALTHSRDLMRYIIEHDQSAVAVHDRDLKYIYVSQRYLHDYGVKERDVIGKGHYEVFPDLPQKWRDVHQRALAGEALSADDDPYVREDGSVDWTRWDCRPWYEADGSIGGIIVYTEVITERKRVNEALRQSEERFRRVSEATSDFAYTCVRPQGGSFAFEWLTGAAERITGWSQEELVGWGCWKALVVQEDVPLFEERVTGLAPGESSVCELRIRHKQGDVRWLAAYSKLEEDAQDPSVHRLHGACQDITERKQAEEEINRQAEQLLRTVEGAVRAMSQVVETRDPYTAGHERRVAELAIAIAAEMGMSAADLDGLRMAGLIHDVGKIAVPAEILSRPGRLSDVELSLIKEHPQAGYDILKAIEFRRPVAEIVLQHHERLDGSGYPQELRGEQISLEARILAVADVVEAMSSHRPYRAALGMEAALAEVRERAGVKYDADVVSICGRLVEEQGFRFTP